MEKQQHDVTQTGNKLEYVNSKKYVEAYGVLLDISVTGEARVARYYNQDGMTYHNKYDGTEHILEFQYAVDNAHLIARHVFSK